MSGKCKGYEIARDQAVSATILPLKTIAEIAAKHCPENRVACVMAIGEAIRLARARIDAISLDDLHPFPHTLKGEIDGETN